MSEEMITSKDAEDFVDYLLTVGGFRTVNATGEVFELSGKPVMIPTAGDPMPLMSYRESSKASGFLMLNPFIDNAVNAPQCNKFYERKSIDIGEIMYEIISTALAFKSSPDNATNYPMIELASIISGIAKPDAKLIAAFNSIDAVDLLFILDKKRDKTAQLKTKLFDLEYQKTKPGIKDKQWLIFQKLFLHIMTSDDVADFNATYKFVSSMINIPNVETQLRVTRMALHKLEKYWITMGGAGFNIPYFDKNLGNLLKFHRISLCMNSVAPAAADDGVVSVVTKPVNRFDTMNQSTVIPTVAPISFQQPATNRFSGIPPVSQINQHIPSPWDTYGTGGRQQTGFNQNFGGGMIRTY